MKGRVVQGFFTAAAARGGGGAGQALDSSILRGTGPGACLPDGLRRDMERVFGASFADVRVHVGPQPERIGAVAFTAGADIFFAPGRYQPETAAGRRLVGHELAHVVQQKSGRARAPASGVAILRDPTLEAEADRMGERAARLIAGVEPRRPSPPRAAAKGGVAVQRMQWSGNSGGWTPQQGFPQGSAPSQGFPTQSFPPQHGFTQPPQQFTPSTGWTLSGAKNEEERKEVADYIAKIKTRLGWRVDDEKELQKEVLTQLQPFVDDYQESLQWRADKAAKEINNRHKVSFEKLQSALVRAIRQDEPSIAIGAVVASGSWHINPSNLANDWPKLSTSKKAAEKLLHDIGRTALNVFIGNAAKNIGSGKDWDYHVVSDPLGRGLVHASTPPELTPFSHAQKSTPFDDIFSGTVKMTDQHARTMAEASFRHYEDLAEKAHNEGRTENLRFFIEKANTLREEVKAGWGLSIGRKLSEWDYA